jgi:hypothetical protein
VILLGNLVNGGFYFSLCNESLPNLFSLLLCTLNGVRILRRVDFLTVHAKIMGLSVQAFFMNIWFFVFLIAVYSLVSVLFLAGRCNSCNFFGEVILVSEQVRQIPNHQTCAEVNGSWKPHLLNYDTYWQSAYQNLMILDRAAWFETVPVILSSEQVSGLPFFFLHLFFVVFFVSFLHIILNGVVTSVCIIQLGTFSKVNLDREITLSKGQTEWIQTEERLAEMKLLVRMKKFKNRWADFCDLWRESRFWKWVYSCSIILGFIANLMTFANESRLLTATKLVFNINLLIIFNLDVYISCQARNFQQLFAESLLK